MVPNTSHWLQVLDDKCFARLKKIVPVLSDDKVIQALMTNQPTRDCLLEAAYEAERMALTRETIQAAFKSVGLYPWDRKQVMELARVNLGLLWETPARIPCRAVPILSAAARSSATAEAAAPCAVLTDSARARFTIR